MTVSSSLSKVAYATNGTTGPFSTFFYVLESSHLKVTYRDAAGITTTLALSVDYTVDGAGEPSGCTVTTLTAFPPGGVLTIVRDVPVTQSTDFRDNDSLPAEALERAVDKLTMILQQQAEQIARAVLAPEGSGISPTLPWPVRQSLIGWNAEGTALENKSPADIAATIASADWRTELFNGDGTTTTFTLQEDPGVASNCDVVIDGLPQHAGKNFTLSGKTLTFDYAAPIGTQNVAVRYGRALPQAGAVSYHTQGIDTIDGLQAALDGKLSLSTPGSQTVAGGLAVNGGIATGNLAAAMLLSGNFQFAFGTLGTQQILASIGPNMNQSLWKYGYEADRSLSFWRYNDAGTYLGRVNLGRDDGSLRTDGLIYGRGGGSGLGQIIVSTADPSGGENGDIWMKV
jgi:hypothetical protein